VRKEEKGEMNSGTKKCEVRVRQNHSEERDLEEGRSSQCWLSGKVEQKRERGGRPVSSGKKLRKMKGGDRTYSTEALGMRILKVETITGP